MKQDRAVCLSIFLMEYLLIVFYFWLVTLKCITNDNILLLGADKSYPLGSRRTQGHEKRIVVACMLSHQRTTMSIPFRRIVEYNQILLGLAICYKKTKQFVIKRPKTICYKKTKHPAVFLSLNFGTQSILSFFVCQSAEQQKLVSVCCSSSMRSTEKSPSPCMHSILSFFVCQSAEQWKLVSACSSSCMRSTSYSL